MEHSNSLNANKLILGLNFGDHEVNPLTIIDEIKKEISGCADMFILRSKAANPLSQETYVSLAKFAKSKNLYFAILYAYQHPPRNKRSHLDKDTVKKIKDIAGELFLGEVFAELSSQSVSQDVGYYVDSDYEKLIMPPQNFLDMQNARTRYVSLIKEMLDYNKSIGIDKSMYIDPTAISAYALEGGITTLMLEMLPGNPEKLVAFTRGATIGHQKNEWGGFVAHEWYGGYLHNDDLKIKRLDLAYKYLYIQGANYIFLESGNTGIESFGYKHDYNSKECKRYRDYTANFYEFAKNNPRPKHGPFASVAFIFGEDDGYADFLGASAWCQFGREDWSQGDRERSWKILDEVYKSYDWFSQENFAHSGVDLSNAPAYGNYDVLPASSPLPVLKNYDYLIFVGHNTMSMKLYEKLTRYVKDGGILFSCVAHMNTDSKRNGKKAYVNDGDLSDLFGVKIVGQERLNHGIKFYTESNVENLIYPATKDLECDANYPSGYTNYAKIELVGAKVCARICNGFAPPTDNDLPVLTEYKNGKGVAMLLTCSDYPGNPAVYPVYKVVVKALLNASHASAEIKVFGSDKVRFSIYIDDDNNKTLYLLNTAFDCPSSISIKTENHTEFITLSPCELKIIKL